MEEHEHANVPDLYAVPGTKEKLGRWLGRQRRRYRKRSEGSKQEQEAAARSGGAMTDAQVKTLEDLGVQWVVSR